jgi:hypothetical protein
MSPDTHGRVYRDPAEHAVEPIVEVLQTAWQRRQQHFVQDFGRAVKAHRRVDHQNFLEIENALFLFTATAIINARY